MKIEPINELMLVASLPGFDVLTKEEWKSIRLISFKYSVFPELTTACVKLNYTGKKQQKVFTYEMSELTGRNVLYQHILISENDFEKEFPNIRKAIDYFKQNELEILKSS